jgi:hypothetical protein
LQAGLGTLGNIYLLEGDARKAIPYYRRALQVARQLRAQSYASVWASNLAAALAEAGEWDEAGQLNAEAQRKTFQEAQTRLSAMLTRARIAGGRKQIAEAKRLYTRVIAAAPANAGQLWEAHAALAGLHWEMGERAQANGHFESAIRIIQKTRAEFFRSENSVTFLSRLIRFYQSYVDLLVEQGEYGKAFQVADWSRSRILAERMNENQGRTGLITVAAYQNAARRMGTCFLSYWVAPRRSFLWVVTSHGIHTFVLLGQDVIGSLVDSYLRLVRGLRDPLASGASPANRLYDILLGQASHLIAPGSKVLLVPDGPLHNLNFETLPVPGQTPHYWIEDVTLSVAPALDVTLARPEAAASAVASLLIVGDPVAAGSEYPKLPNAADEMKGVQQAFSPAETVVCAGTRATPAGYRDSLPERFSYIHFAAHSVANQTSPLDSAIVLSPQSGEFLLSARDIAHQTLRAQLVTIASCRSAGARNYPGEGPVGLAWAFLRAGAANVIAGLWDVSDSSTAETMVLLYSELAKGTTSVEALRAAKLALIRRPGVHHKPYYWGPFQNYIGWNVNSG